MAGIVASKVRKARNNKEQDKENQESTMYLVHGTRIMFQRLHGTWNTNNVLEIACAGQYSKHSQVFDKISLNISNRRIKIKDCLGVSIIL